MKFKMIQKTMESIGKTFFAEGKPLAFFYPLFEAADTFFFTPGAKTTGSCHVRDCNDFKRMMIAVMYALIPCALVGIFNIGYQANLIGSVPHDIRGEFILKLNALLPFLGILKASNPLGCFIFGLFYYLPIYVVTMVVGLFWEIIFAGIYRHDVNEGFFVTGFIFPLIVPPTIPLWQVALAISFGVVIGKEIFGGTGRNFLNPALVARAFLFFAYAGQISGDQVWTVADGVSKATPLTCAADGVLAIKSAGYSMFGSFMGTIPGAIGETSTLACLIGMAFLLFVGVASWRIIFSMFVGGMTLAALLTFSGPDAVAARPILAIGPFWHFVLGGFAFGMVFMATDPVTASATRFGQYIYGFLIGALVIVVRVFNPAYPEGVMLVILFGNCVAPLIDHFVVEVNIRRRMKRLESR